MFISKMNIFFWILSLGNNELKNHCEKINSLKNSSWVIHILYDGIVLYLKNGKNNIFLKIRQYLVIFYLNKNQ